MVVVELIQSLVFFGNSANLVRYFLQYMHYSVAQSSNMLTNFMGTSFLLSIVAGYINDTVLSTLIAFIVYVSIELLGFILLTYQATHSNLLPSENETPSYIQAAVLYIGLGAIAIGIGGTKATLPTHGANQLDPNKQNLISSFFNWYYFSINTASIFAATLMVWIEENCGWGWSFTISAILVFCSISIFSSGSRIYRLKQPAGSPLKGLIKVIVASTRKTIDAAAVQVYHNDKEQSYAKETSYNKFKFLNKALKDDTIEVSQVEDTKAFLGLLPIFATTIVLNCCVAQLMTFSVQQGNFMNRKISNFTITTQSISVIPLFFILGTIGLIEKSKDLYSNTGATYNKFYQPLVRMGVGLTLTAVSMAVAAVVESWRLAELNKGYAISVFWLTGQNFLLVLSEVFAVGGMLELFYSDAPNGMKSVSTSLSWCSISLGYFLSSVLVTVCNSVSGRFGQAWIEGQDLNHDRLDLFYALLCLLSLLNVILYVYFAKRY
ncbi:putative proton-dependent oligopeptide transporter family, major facilitator superfamily [Lupinus albus]|uniref:Putative proton-dependent oligopeptide transporter family, major facilitator superfamily n=1 Tax=Lupinus albus TaxID=3870 RepID=A0A6A4QWG5_LUPAL|nr:putative proton-dependent oligopeptide transporter family, major facilitator superfamily [Lupinus albus]